MKRLRKLNTKGFTLLEMLVVLLVVGILMALIIPNISGQKEKIEQQAKQNIAQIIETQVSTYQLMEKDNSVTLSDLQSGGYITEKQANEAQRLLEISNNDAISIPIQID